MSFNKKILALAIAGALPGASHAVVSLIPPGPSVPVVYAQEVVLPAVGDFLSVGGAPSDTSSPPDGDGDGPATGLLGVKMQLGFSIVGSSKYVRLDFPDTKLAQALTARNFSTTLAGGALPPVPGTLTISAGGAVGSSFVIVEVAGANLSNLDEFHFTLSDGVTAALPSMLPAQKIQPQSKGPHTITYRLYNSPVDAVTNNPANALSTASDIWYKFGPGLNLSCAPSASKKINVTDKTKFVDGSSVTDLFTLTATGLGTLRSNGAAVITTDYLPTGSTFKVTGNVQNILGAGGTLNLSAIPAALTATTGTWTTPTPPLDYLGALVTFDPDGVTPMLAGDYTVLVTQGASPVFPLSPNPVDLGICGRLTFSGSSDRVDYGLTPGSTNKQYLRITNPTITNGAVNVSVWNDAGVQVDFPLSAVKVGTAPGVNLPAVLQGFASTPIIDVNAFDAAAKSINPGFTVGTGIDGKPGKIRIEVRGAFGDDHLDGNSKLTFGPTTFTPGNPSTVRLKNGIYIQAINNGAFHQSH